MKIRIGINGFGRIGRLVYRIATKHGGFEVVAVNDLVPAENLAYLLKYDSTHGRLPWEIKADDKGFSVANDRTTCLSERDPAALKWQELGVDYVLESTGRFRGADQAKGHLEAGAKRVLISAPTTTPDTVPTYAYKVNHQKYNPETDKIISNASCTTNCLAPIAKVIHDQFGLAEGLMTTVHAATATQPTQDGASAKDWRGGRNAYTNIIPASTRSCQGRRPMHS